jgi:hypothetical protein
MITQVQAAVERPVAVMEREAEMEVDKDFTYLNPEVTPEPASMALWATGGLVGLAYRTRRRSARTKSKRNC